MHLQFHDIEPLEAEEIKSMAYSRGKKCDEVPNPMTVAYQKQGNFTICELRIGKGSFVGAVKCALKFDKYNLTEGKAKSLAKAARQWAGFTLESNGHPSRARKARDLKKAKKAELKKGLEVKPKAIKAIRLKPVAIKK